MILKHLMRLQQRHGWVSNRMLRDLSERIHEPLYRIEELVSFYPHLRREPPPQVEIKICRDMACHLCDATQVREDVEKLKSKHGWSDDQVSIVSTSCLAQCDRAPAATIEVHRTSHNGQDQEGHHVTCLMPKTDGERLADAAEQALAGSLRPASASGRGLPIHDNSKEWLIDVYRYHPDRNDFNRYETIHRYLRGEFDRVDRRRRVKLELKQLDPEGAVSERAVRAAVEQADQEDVPEVLQALRTAVLLGKGGPGLNTYDKWLEVRCQQNESKFVVCNADESEPSTFKDRELLLQVPHLVVEGVILASLVVGADQAYIYVRHEFPDQIAALEREIKRAQNELPQCRVRVEVFTSPGGYICGEQTALIEALQDNRAEPRNRPPELQTNGLHNRPTLINNVETFAWVPAILLHREEDKKLGQWHANLGQTPKREGRRFFSICGHVNRPGVYEVPVEITLGELIERYAGGMQAGREFKAVALMGPSGGFTPRRPKMDTLRMSEALKQEYGVENAERFDVLNLRIGNTDSRGGSNDAGITVVSDATDYVSLTRVCSEFYRNESCGKCVPCRIGSYKIAELAGQIARRQPSESELELISKDVAQLHSVMDATSICGLGQVASKPLQTYLTYRKDFS